MFKVCLGLTGLLTIASWILLVPLTPANSLNLPTHFSVGIVLIYLATLFALICAVVKK